MFIWHSDALSTQAKGVPGLVLARPKSHVVQAVVAGGISYKLALSEF